MARPRQICEKGASREKIPAGAFFYVGFAVRLFGLADAVKPAPEHAKQALALFYHYNLHRGCLPFPWRSNEKPRATRITAERNKVSPMGQKLERDIPKPKLIAHKHLHR